MNAGIGQGFVEVTPLALCTYASRVATGRAVEPHLTRTLGGTVQAGVDPQDWPSMNLSESHLQLCRQGMFAVVNEPGGTAPLARLNMPGIQTGRKDRVPARCATSRASCGRPGTSSPKTCPGNTARTRCSSASRRTTRRVMP